jgi:hypothetical protein
MVEGSAAVPVGAFSNADGAEDEALESSAEGCLNDWAFEKPLNIRGLTKIYKLITIGYIQCNLAKTIFKGPCKKDCII